MAVASSASSVVHTYDGVPLRTKLRQAERMRKIKALGLILPLFVFLLLAFIIPIGTLLFISVENPEIPTVLPRTAQAIQSWDGEDLPGDDILRPFIEELQLAQENRVIGKPAKRLNYNITGYRSLMLKTGRRLVGKKRIAMAPPAPGTLGVTGNTDSGKGAETVEAVVVTADSDNLIETLIDIDKRWGERKYWLALKDAAGPYTAYYMLAALDRETNTDGDIVTVPERKRLYIDVLYRTFWISLVVTVVCFVLGYPLAYLLATVPTKYGNLLMILVLLPFWTSLLVRTTAWVVLLQREGVVNDAAMSLGVLSERVKLIHNRFGVYVAMVHILLPFMVLPIFLHESLCAANHSRHRRGLPARFHHLARLLHHAGAGRRRCRPDDELLHRLLHQPDHQLGHVVRPECDPASLCPGDVLDIQPLGWYRQNEDGLSQWHCNHTPRRGNASGTIRTAYSVARSSYS
jgi:putative spermidine/putrescine transport system permease protein